MSTNTTELPLDETQLIVVIHQEVSPKYVNE